MVLRTRHHRWWLVAAYVMAAVLAHCAHRHGADHDTPAHCLPSCDDVGVHLSGHTSQDLDHHGSDCTACHFRSSHQAVPILAAAPFYLASVAIARELTDPQPRRMAALRPACRAPPRV